jgi:WhiB family redox-sensing transcriptional regulator
MTEDACPGDWWAGAACRFADPDLFFPVSSSGLSRFQVAEAKELCARCQVRPECLQYALQAREVHGVWGGTSEEERQDLTRLDGSPSRVSFRGLRTT